MRNNANEIKLNPDGSLEGLVSSKRLLEILFPDENSRPTVRWLEMNRKARKIPFIKISRLVFFNPIRVREALNYQRSAKFGGGS
jgi:hypothetical protein